MGGWSSRAEPRRACFQERGAVWHVQPHSPQLVSAGVLGSPLISLLFWILICFSITALFTRRYSIRPLIVALILRSIYYLGIGPTLHILGALNVSETPGT